MTDVHEVQGKNLLAVINHLLNMAGWDIAIVPRGAMLDMLSMANGYHDLAQDLLKMANPEWSMWYNHAEKKVEIIGTKH